MILDQQKNIFLRTPKGIKAVAFARKWFNDFSMLRLEPLFLQDFYAAEKYGIDGYEALSIPLNAEQEMNDYEVLFWFWFYKRYDRLQTEHQIYLDIEAYKKEIAEIEAGNPLKFISDIFSGLGTVVKYVPYLLLGGLFFYGYRTFKK